MSTSWRSCSVEHASSAALSASSLLSPSPTALLNAAIAAGWSVPRWLLSTCALMLVQLRASARPPVTLPVRIVSLALSMRFSTGRASPNALTVPAAMLYHASMSAPASARLFMSCAASTAWSLSPTSPRKFW